jgi:hypothetical protein
MCERCSDGTYKKGHKGICGESNVKWKAENAGYCAKHAWIKRHYGKANHCEFNINHKSKNYEWCNISGKYKRSRDDFLQLCRSCHRKFDKGGFCSKGHKFDLTNTWIRKNGWRVCKICQKIRHLKWMRKAG